ncbi:hypothetical protein Q4553_13605 [Tenacibaculum soleae]|uniref:hypothetical protein n=1 Tax=Tenacibaculum soleae TaxID=447689 RepID=UPI0026E328AA|nr:hypothetical protein [Tenacibaculum soleae]MDO6745599.1 hypothetical protein [Tenacibaculum soleae]
MDKILERILKFFENKSFSFRLRTSIFIICLFVLFTSDYFFDFTYDYHLANKIEKLESINKLKKIYESDSLKIIELKKVENRIFNRTHYSDRLRNLDLNQINIFKKSDKTEIISPVIKNDNTTINKPIRSFFWMVLTSGYFFIILIVLLFILPFRGYPHNELKNVLGSIAGIIILIGVIGFLTWVAYAIPIISLNHPYLNYILNAILQSPLIYLIFWWNKTEKN